MIPVLQSMSRVRARLVLAAAVAALAGTLTLTVKAAPQGPGPAQCGHDMAMGMPMMGGPEHMAAMLENVGASAEQRAQVKQIMDGAAADLGEQRSAGRSTHEQMMQLFTQTTVDANVAEALRKQMLAQHDQASKRMLQAMLDVSRVLTPEQRKQLADRMSQRHSMMERHRSERATLDKPAQ